MRSESIYVVESLKRTGYTTGYFGKWHLAWRGRPKPEQKGYDTVARYRGKHFGFDVHGTNPPEPSDNAYLAEYLTDRTNEFIERKRNRPFFAFLSHYAVHIPLQARRKMIEKYRDKSPPEKYVNNPVYAAMIEHCDHSVGRILEKLKNWA